MNLQRRCFLVLVAVFLFANAPSVRAAARLEPPTGCYFGVNLGEGDTIDRLSARLGITPAVQVRFFSFPLTQPVREQLTGFLSQVRASRSIALITLEPFQGLASVTDAECLDLAGICATNEALGIGGIMIRFAHEMNGNWYPWCQQPILYKEKFQLLAEILHTNTTRTATLWAPHNGLGYPFSTNGLYQATNGSPDFATLDTDGNGTLTAADDMYAPYYPGDDAVDWVGLTIYHWGAAYPWLENEMPAPNAFAVTLRGTGHQPPIPDFYARYCAEGTHNKPLCVPETSAFFNPHQPAGPGEFPIKQAWWKQVFNISDENTNSPNVAVEFPKLKCVNWFDHYKPEAEAQSQWVDWRISTHLPIRSAFVEQVRSLRNDRPYFLTAQEFHALDAAYAIVPVSLPQVLPLSGAVSVALEAKATTNCDLVIDLLDQSFNWQGGTRVPVTAGTQSVNTAFNLIQPLADGANYRWSIFLTPTGGGHTQALTTYVGVQPVARAANSTVEIVAGPPFTPAGSNMTMRVKYASPQPALVQVNLLSLSSNLLGSGFLQTMRHHGYMDVTVTPNPGITNNHCWCEAVLSPSTNAAVVLARSSLYPVSIGPGGDSNAIHVVTEPSCISTGDVFRFTVAYAAADDADLHVDLFDSTNQFLAGAVQRVGRSHGVQDMTISLPEARPGRYFINSFMTPPGQSYTQAVAWSASRTNDVVGLDYIQWAESLWGFVFATDAIHPAGDPDADGAGNWQEFVALTNPRNASHHLRLNTTFTNSQVVIGWMSALGRNYRVLESSNFVTGPWTPLGSALPGTGGSISVPLNPQASGPRKFYRLEALLP